MFNKDQKQINCIINKNIFKEKFNLKQINSNESSLSFINSIILFYGVVLNKTICIKDLEGLFLNYLKTNRETLLIDKNYLLSIDSHVINYFKNKKSDICETIIEITPSVLNINVYIFEVELERIIRIIKFKPKEIIKMNHNMVETLKTIYLIRYKISKSKI